MRSTVLILLFAALVSTACTSTRLEDAMPEAALRAGPANATSAPDGLSAEVPADAPVAAEGPAELSQMTPGEREAFLAEIAAARQSQAVATGGAAPPRTTDLSGIAKAEANETLKEIEGE
jgi:hypothetical protein